MGELDGLAARFEVSRPRLRAVAYRMLGAGLARQREVVEAFLAASRSGDFEALLAVLDPDVTLRADVAATPPGLPRQARGAAVVAGQGLAFSRRAQSARLALVNGAVGVILAPHGRLSVALSLTIVDGKITEMDVVANPGRLAQLDLAVLAD